MYTFSLIGSGILLALPGSMALAPRAACGLSFDGRIAANAVAADIDDGQTNFRAANVLGEGSIATLLCYIAKTN